MPGCRSRVRRIAVWLPSSASRQRKLKTWRLELEAAGSAAARAAQKAEAAELVQLRRDNKRLTEEVEVLRKASAFFAQWAAKT